MLKVELPEASVLTYKIWKDRVLREVAWSLLILSVDKKQAKQES